MSLTPRCWPRCCTRPRSAFAFIGPDSRFLRMNPVMASLTDGDDADQAGRTPAQVWPPDLAEAAQAALRRVAAGDRPVPQTEHAIAAPQARARRTGQVRTWSFSWFPSRDGEVSGVAAIAVDVTPQHAGGRGGAPQRGALPLAGAGGRPGGVGDQAGRRDRRGLARVALDHRADRRGVPQQGLARGDPQRRQGARRGGLARLRAVGQGLRQPVPGAQPDRLLQALRRARGADRARRQDHRVDGRQHGRHRAA